MSTDGTGQGGGNAPNNTPKTHGPGRILVQLITPSGERVSHPEFDLWVKDITDEHLCSLFEDMTVIRRIDVEATALQRQGELALWPPLLGQEAAQIGSGRALRDDDFVFSSYRENGVAYCRGVDLTDMIRVWRGNRPSGWDPYEVNMATPQVIIIHGRKIIMDQRIAMHHFNRSGDSQGALARYPEQSGGA